LLILLSVGSSSPHSIMCLAIYRKYSVEGSSKAETLCFLKPLPIKCTQQLSKSILAIRHWRDMHLNKPNALPLLPNYVNSLRSTIHGDIHTIYSYVDHWVGTSLETFLHAYTYVNWESHYNQYHHPSYTNWANYSNSVPWPNIWKLTLLEVQSTRLPEHLSLFSLMYYKIYSQKYFL